MADALAHREVAEPARSSLDPLHQVSASVVRWSGHAPALHLQYHAGFVRGSSFNIYTHPWRVTSSYV